MNASRFFIGIARASLRQGRVELASRAGRAAMDMSPEAGAEHDRALLYSAAADAVTERSAGALAVLQSMSEGTLSQDERGVRMAAMAMAEEVQRGLPVAKPSDAEGTAGQKRISSPGATRDRAIQALKISGELLQEARP
jgi:chemotaxis protein MotC